MKLKICNLILMSLGLGLASTSFALLPFLPKNLQEKPLSAVRLQQIKQSHESYANFSGHWSGFCDDSPE